MQGGGIETTAMTAVTQFAHHGMIFVPCGYAFGEFLWRNWMPAAFWWRLQAWPNPVFFACAGAQMFDVENVKGGTPWGASTLAGPTGARYVHYQRPRIMHEAICMNPRCILFVTYEQPTLSAGSPPLSS